jgi:hypothetical protein
VREARWKDYTAIFGVNEGEILRDYVSYATQLIEQEDWLGAEKWLLRTQNIQEGLPDSLWVETEMANVEYLLARIAYEVQDHEGCLEGLDFASSAGYPAVDLSKLRAQCEQDVPVPDPIRVQPSPPQFAGTGKRTSVTIDLGAGYLQIEPLEVKSGGDLGDSPPALAEPNSFEVTGGRAYHVTIDVLRQFRSAAVQASIGVITLSLLLL